MRQVAPAHRLPTTTAIASSFRERERLGREGKTGELRTIKVAKMTTTIIVARREPRGRKVERVSFMFHMFE